MKEWAAIGVRSVIPSIRLIGMLFYEIVQSSLKVMYWILIRPKSLSSEFLWLKLSTQSEWKQIFIAHFITLTPGTLSVDIDHKKKKIFIHILNSNEAKSLEKLIKNRVEPLLKKIGRSE